MSTIVIGGAGFIGLHVCRELQRQGHDPVILDTFVHKGSEAAASKLVQSANVLAVDATDPAALGPHIQAGDTVFNLATVCVREALRNPIRATADISALGMVPAAVCARHPEVRYVYVSSSEIYGSALGGKQHEGTLPQPCTVYGAAKLAGEFYARSMHLQKGLDISIIRPFNAYGPGCHIGGIAGEVIPRWIMQALQGEPLTLYGGAQSRDFTYVTDLAAGIVAAGLDRRLMNTGPINLASGIEKTLRSVATSITLRYAAALQQQPPRPADLTRQIGGASRARLLLGWEPTVTWEAGLDRTCTDMAVRRGSEGDPEMPSRAWEA